MTKKDYIKFAAMFKAILAEEYRRPEDVNKCIY
jgi:hypothetical protein